MAKTPPEIRAQELLQDIRQAFMQMRYYEGGAASGAIVTRSSKEADADWAPRDPERGETLLEKYTDPYGTLARVVWEMQRDVERCRKGGRRVEDKEDRNKRIIVQYEGWPAEKASVFEGLSQSQIRRIREQGNVRPSNGLKADSQET